MTPVEDRMRALLHEAAPDASGVSFDAVERRVRGRRHVLAAGVATAVAAVVAGVAIAVAAMPSNSSDGVATGPTPTSAPPRSVTFQGISFVLPDGWTVAQPGCRSPDGHTVVLGTWTGSCPLAPRNIAATAVRLTSIYGRQFALNWPGHRATWQGQPAWLATEKTG